MPKEPITEKMEDMKNLNISQEKTILNPQTSNHCTLNCIQRWKILTLTIFQTNWGLSDIPVVVTPFEEPDTCGLISNPIPQNLSKTIFQTNCNPCPTKISQICSLDNHKIYWKSPHRERTCCVHKYFLLLRIIPIYKK